MPSQQIIDLIERWDDLREQGRELTAEELCEDCPELTGEVRRRLQSFQAMDWIRESEDEVAIATVVPGATPTEAIPVISKLTSEEFLTSLQMSGLIPEESWESTVSDLVASSDSNAYRLAEQLIDCGQLTAFQARVLLERRSDPLIVDRYVVLGELGSGGMGTVYKAQHRSLERIVALKVLPRSLIGTPQAEQRFKREGQAVARLDHPNIVSAFDADEADGRLFLAMEFVAGRNLNELVQANGPLPAATAVDYVRQAAEGLAYAHQQGVVHRDVKPANLLLSENRQVKVADLGLASFREHAGGEDAGAQSLTTTGAVIGTVAYISPEQSYDTKQANEQSDIYSLGASLFYLLTGSPPYVGDNVVQTLVAHREAAIPSPKDYGIHVTDELESVCQRMLAKRPEDRPSSMNAVINLLEGLPQSVPVSLADTVEFSAERNQSSETKTSTWKRFAAIAAPLMLLVLAAIIIKITHRDGSVTKVDVGDAQRVEILQSKSADPPNPPVRKTKTPPQQTVTTGDPPNTVSREFAEWVFQRGGKLAIKSESGYAEPRQAGELPDHPFVITYVFLRNNAMDDSDLAKFARHKRLTKLHVSSRSLTNEGMGHLAKLPHLRSISFDGVSATDFSPLSDLDLTYLHINSFKKITSLPSGRYPNLYFVNLRESQLAPGVIATIGNYKSVEVLYLAKTGIGDDDVAKLGSLQTLKDLGLEDTSVTDAGLKHLIGLPRLQRLRLHGTNISADGVRWFRERRKNCQIDWDQPANAAHRKAPASLIAPFDAEQAVASREAWASFLGVEKEFKNSLGMRLHLIPPGEFPMGSPPAESEQVQAHALGFLGMKLPERRIQGEQPRHPVRITRAFYLGRHEVTVAQFREFVKATNYVTQAERCAPYHGWFLMAS